MELTKFWAYLPFLLRCVHSLTGIACTLFLCEHLFTNMMASSYFREGALFVSIVNRFHQIPGLHYIELVCLAVPFFAHGIIGVVYLLLGKSNAGYYSGKAPALHYERNYSYVLQRVSAFLLLLGLVFHVIQFRFILYPLHIVSEGKTYYAVKIAPERYKKVVRNSSEFLLGEDLQIPLPKGTYLLTPTSGQAFLYTLRNTLGSLWMAIFYTLLVFAAAFHGFNGLWTCCCRWGVIVTTRQFAYVRLGCFVIMAGVAALGISMIWNIYIV